MNADSQLAYHRSRLDQSLQPVAVCATDDGLEPMPLIVELSIYFLYINRMPP